MSNPTNQREAEKPRKTKMFFVNYEGVVRHVMGYDCSGKYESNDGMWWLPDVGYSQHEKYLFSDSESAREAAKKHCAKQIEFWKERLRIL